MSSMLVILFGFLSGTLVQCNPDLIPSVPSESQVFINQPITIQCITRGSQALAWRSDEYIGPGQQLSFNINSIPGDTDSSLNGAEATFVRLANDNGEMMLQSIIRISVVLNFINFTVTCRNIDTGSEESVTYQTMNSNITEVTLLPFEAGNTCPNNNVTVKCVARRSQNIQWGSSNNIGLSSVMPRCSSDGQPQRYDINGIEVISTMHSFDTDRLTCCLTLLTPRFPVETPLYITCINLDFQVGVNVSFKIAGDCISTTSVPKSSTSMITSTDSGSNPTHEVVTSKSKAGSSETHIVAIAGGATGGVLVILVVLVIVIIVIVVITKVNMIPAKVSTDKQHCTDDHYPEPHQYIAQDKFKEYV